MLALDLRESRGSQERADGQWRRREVDLADGSHLRFGSRPTWAEGKIVVEERYVRLLEAGYHDVAITSGVGRRTDDRYLVVARR